MSDTSTVKQEDYGLTESVDTRIVKVGPERRIWETVQVAPDPLAPGKFYVVQRLAGAWKRSAELNDETLVKWVQAWSWEPPVSRVLYCKLDEFGIMQNLNRATSQGKSL